MVEEVITSKLIHQTFFENSLLYVRFNIYMLTFLSPQALPTVNNNNEITDFVGTDIENVILKQQT